jgi:hypothetical protein
VNEPLLAPSSLPTRLDAQHEDELMSLPFGGSQPLSDEPDVDLINELTNDRDPLMGNHARGNYGSVNNPEPSTYEDVVNRRINRGRLDKSRKRIQSTTVSSLTRLIDEDDDDDDSSDEEEPPTIPMKYKRTGKDLVKLLFLPALYFVLMLVAILFAFYTIEGLIISYNNKVRSVQSIDVNGIYKPIGIAVYPDFSEYVGCEHKYFDDLAPIPADPLLKETCNITQLRRNCEVFNITYNSTILEDVVRQAMVFRGPTLFKCKESLQIRFNINTTARRFSAVEYILFDSWDHFINASYENKQRMLASFDEKYVIYTFPAGFRTWVKMSYSISNYGDKRNVTDFSIIDNYASYNDLGDDGLYPMEVLFEWKDKYYDYITELVSTTIWSAFGSICGILVTLMKAAEFCKMWIRRIRREKEKKILHLKKLEEEQKKLMESFEQRQRERRETKLRKSLEATKTVLLSQNRTNT